MKKIFALILIAAGLGLGVYNSLHRLDIIGPKPGIIRKLSFISRFKEQRKEEALIIGGIVLTITGVALLKGKKKV